MVELGLWHYVGIIATLSLVAGVGIYAGKHVKNNHDFIAGGARAGSISVAGSLLGVLMGGSATVGTAQLGFTNGLSGIWFALGSAMGCILYVLVYAIPLRHSGCTTLQQVITKEYGKTAGMISSIMGVVVIFFSLAPQMLSAIALIGSLFSVSNLMCAVITISLILSMVLFGGASGTGSVGTIKTILLYIAACGGGLLAFYLVGGPSVLVVSLPAEPYFNLTSRGFGIDFGGGMAVAVGGVMASQSYVPCVLSARDDKTAKRGIWLAALLLLPIGIGGTVIGMFMKTVAPDMISKQAFPQFALQNMPGLLAGVVLAGLMIAIMGTASGVVLAIGTIISQDVFRTIKKDASDNACLLANRIAIIVALVVALLLVAGDSDTPIISWSYLAVALRAAQSALPLTMALFMPGKFDKRFVIASIFISPLLTLIAAKMFSLPFDSIFVALPVSGAIMAGGYIKNRQRQKNLL